MKKTLTMICFVILSFVCTVNVKADVKITINKATQLVQVTDGENVLRCFPCSTGKNNCTPRGNFKTSDYYRQWHALYKGKFAYGAIRFYKNVLIHSVPYTKQSLNCLELEEFNKLGSEASMGCVRVSGSDMTWLLNNTKPGDKVVVIDDPGLEWVSDHKIPLTRGTGLGSDPTLK